MTPPTKHVHVLRLDPGLTGYDVWAATLALASRGHFVLSGPVFRAERNELAALLAGGALAELLESGRPIRVLGVEHGYQFEEV